MVSAAAFEPATHALKGSPTQSQPTTCTSSLLHARHNKINEMPTRHRSGCPEGARNPGLPNNVTSVYWILCNAKESLHPGMRAFVYTHRISISYHAHSEIYF